MTIDNQLGYISFISLIAMFTYFMATYDFNLITESVEIFKAAMER